MRVPRFVQDIGAGIDYRLHSGKREEEATELYYGFNRQAERFRSSGTTRVRRGVQVSAKAPNNQGLIAMAQIDEVPTGERTIRYFRNGPKGRITRVSIRHQVEPTEATRVVLNDRKRSANSARTLRVAKGELDLAKEAQPTPTSS